MTPAERALAAWEAGANLPRQPYTQPHVQRPAPKTRPEPRPESDFMSVEEAARIMGVSKMTVYRAIADRVLPAYKFRRSYRIRKRDFAEFVSDSLVEDDDE